MERQAVDALDAAGQVNSGRALMRRRERAKRARFARRPLDEKFAGASVVSFQPFLSGACRLLMKIQATAEMLIRAKRSDVFRAFVEPKWLCRFWLSRASAPLTKGTTAEWEFMVPGARDTVRASRFEQNRRLTLRWSDGSTSHLSFRQHARGIVHVTVTTSGFRGSDAANQAVGNAEGFAIVLCDLKALLETGKSGGMVRDRAALIATRE